MFKTIKNTRKGFTLIELLVVIAIIGILSSVVLASLSTARQKSRDAKRISDVGQIQLALELYFDQSQSYPSTTPDGYTGTDAAVQLLEFVKFMPQTPIPPSGGSPNYIYHGITQAGGLADCTGAACLSYVVSVALEREDNAVLRTDADITTSGGTVMNGGTTTCLDDASAPERCYDIQP